MHLVGLNCICRVNVKIKSILRQFCQVITLQIVMTGSHIIISSDLSISGSRKTNRTISSLHQPPAEITPLKGTPEERLLGNRRSLLTCSPPFQENLSMQISISTIFRLVCSFIRKWFFGYSISQNVLQHLLVRSHWEANQLQAESLITRIWVVFGYTVFCTKKKRSNFFSEWHAFVCFPKLYL